MQRIAIIGSGIAGLGAAWLLRERAEVTVFEQNARPGGHVNTIDTPDGGIDTGFIVHNDRNYPLFSGLIEELGVPVQASDMSFGISLDDGRIEWAGDSLPKLFARRALAADPRHWRMLTDIIRFNRRAKALIAADRLPAQTLGAFLDGQHYSHAFTQRYLLPMAAAIWSTPRRAMRDFPVANLFRFFHNHGLLDMTNRPQWRTILGGARRYVRALTARLGDERMRLGTPVTGIERCSHDVALTTAHGERERYDQIVFACHPPTSLALLRDASTREKQVLGAFTFTVNRAVLHTDATLMPQRRLAWSSWNYIGASPAREDQATGVTYWMNRLQRLAATRQYFVSLNPVTEPAPDRLIEEIEYEHPLFDQKAIAAQSRLASVQGRGGIWHCGAWAKNGFHEDGFAAAADVAAALGARQSREPAA